MNVLYLTGAPAAGKSSATRALMTRIPDIAIFEYGDQLTKHLRSRQPALTQEDLRQRSAGAVTPEDVEYVDKQLLQFVETHRAARPVVIDSHPVTKESFGYRVTPFSLEQFRLLKPSKIVVLYTSSDVAIKRIRNDPAGRPLVSEWEAGFHTGLQSAVAVSYSTAGRVPAYFIDSSVDREAVVDQLERILLG